MTDAAQGLAGLADLAMWMPTIAQHFGAPVLTDAIDQERRRALLICAAIEPLFHAVDRLTDVFHPWLALGLRLSWALVLLVAGLSIGRAPPRLRGPIAGAAGVLTAVHYIALLAATGGVKSPLFAWTLALPVCIPLLVRDQVWATVTSGAVLAVGSAALLGATDAPSRELAVWCLLCLASLIVAVLTTLVHARTLAGQRLLVNERLDALQQVAEKERERAHADRLSIVGRIAAGVAHEVNNPLAFILENVHYLRDKSRGTALAAEDEVFADVQEGLDRIRRIVDDLRTFCRTESAVVEPVSLKSVTDESLRIAALRLGPIQVALDLPDLPSVRGNRTRLVQVLVNLLFNAADALEGRRGGVRISGLRTEAGVRLVVEDDGPGIPADLLERIFQPFLTTKAVGKGTGLGLAVSREYVERAGGKLSVENHEGGGARFIVDCAVWDERDSALPKSAAA